ncbi:hypothetical protein [Salibacterium sp. K-3]
MHSFKVFTASIFILLFVACNNDEASNRYVESIESHGWEVKKTLAENEPSNFEKHEELQDGFEAVGFNFDGYSMEDISISRYEVTFQCTSFNFQNELSAGVLHTEKKIIDSYIKNNEATPGLSKMVNKEKYVNEHCN